MEARPEPTIKYEVFCLKVELSFVVGVLTSLLQPYGFTSHDVCRLARSSHPRGVSRTDTSHLGAKADELGDGVPSRLILHFPKHCLVSGEGWLVIRMGMRIVG